jgi:MFS family permease
VIEPGRDAASRRAVLGIAALSLGTTLNPLNSSMIAVALIALQRDFAVTVAEVTWVVTLFYVASLIAQPLMGRLVDAFGSRRIFCAGMGVVITAGAMAPLAPLTGSHATGFALVLVSRGVLAVGTSVAFPAAIALVAPLAEIARLSPARVLARIQVANTTAAALGPVVGGLLIAWAGWQAIFLMNIPVALIALVAVRALAPGGTRQARKTAGGLVRELDPLGALAFGVAAVTLVLALLGAVGTAARAVVAIGLVALGLFIWRELRAGVPFIDVRMLAANRALALSYAAFAAFTALFYLAFFGVAQMLEARGGYSPALVGLLMLPLMGLTILVAPAVARLIDRRGLALTIAVMAVLLLVAAGTLAIAIVTTAPIWMLLMTAVMGLPYCMGSLAVTEAVRRTAPAEAVGVASGLLQSTRYLGAIIATVVLGHLLSAGADAASWRMVVIAAVTIGAVHAVLATYQARSLRPPTAGGAA